MSYYLVSAFANVQVRLFCTRGSVFSSLSFAGLLSSFLSTHHALVWVMGLVGSVQQLTVLQLFTQPLKGVDWLIQLYWHGHLGQILTDVVPQDIPQAHAAGGSGGGQCGAATSQGHHAAN